MVARRRCSPWLDRSGAVGSSLRATQASLHYPGDEAHKNKEGKARERGCPRERSILVRSRGLRRGLPALSGLSLAVQRAHEEEEVEAELMVPADPEKKGGARQEKSSRAPSLDGNGERQRCHCGA